jgi:hypothetical protein
MKAKMLLFIFIIIFSISCKKKDNGIDYRISEPFKEWTYFIKGCYWIYLNDSTHVEDSTYISTNPSDLIVPINNSNYEGYSHEFIETHLNSTFYNYSQAGIDLYGTEWFNVVLNNYGFEVTALVASGSDNFINSSQEFYSNSVIARDSVFYINQMKFVDVVNTQILDITSGKSYTFWFSKKVGLIKVIGKKTTPEFSWSLIRYHTQYQ